MLSELRKNAWLSRRKRKLFFCSFITHFIRKATLKDSEGNRQSTVPSQLDSPSGNSSYSTEWYSNFPSIATDLNSAL